MAREATIRRGLLGLACCALAVLLFAPPARSEDQLTAILASVLTTPRAVQQSDGIWRVPYEISVINAAPVPMTVESVEVLAPERDDAVLSTLRSFEIMRDLIVPGGVKTSTLAPGQSGVLFVNLKFQKREEIPTKLEHRFTTTTTNTDSGVPPRSVEVAAPTTVSREDPIVLGPPLRGDRWVAAASCCDSYHRRAVLPVNGQRHLAQRFAIDWIRLDPEGRLATGDPKQNASYPQYGAEALAVANGTVVSVVNDMPDGEPGKFPEGVTAASADGNSVVLDLGKGRFALYAHFQPGSIRVKKGQRVKRGQVLGLVGDSGNSDVSHLHLHVMDGPSPLASNGLPYVFESFEVTGRARSGDELETQLKTPDQPVTVGEQEGEKKRSKMLPAELAVIRFPN